MASFPFILICHVLNYSCFLVDPYFLWQEKKNPYFLWGFGKVILMLFSYAYFYFCFAFFFGKTASVTIKTHLFAGNLWQVRMFVTCHPILISSMWEGINVLLKCILTWQLSNLHPGSYYQVDTLFYCKIDPCRRQILN